MFAELPDWIDPWQAVAAQAEFFGTWPLAGLARLGPELAHTAGMLRFRLAFSREAEGRRGLVHGEVSATLGLVCQRCLEPFEHEVQASLALALVSGLDEARALPDAYDPLLVTGTEMIRPLDLLEDELLLALPQIPRHPLASCGARSRVETLATSREESAPRRPFAILAHWRRSDS